MFVCSVLIHALLLFFVSFSIKNVSNNPKEKKFDIHAIKLLNVKPKSKDKLNSKSDSKTGKKIRKKKSDKAFPQKGKRQAIAPKAPLENLKKTASKTPKNKNTPLSKVENQQQQQINKTTKLAEMEPVKRELKDKLIPEHSKKVASLEKKLQPKKYTKQMKVLNKKQITPLKKIAQKQTKTNTQQKTDKLKRRETPKTPKQPSPVKMRFPKPVDHLRQENKNIKLAAKEKRQIKINKRLDYQQKRLTTERVEIKQRQIKQSVPVTRKTAIAPNKLLKVSQTITEVKRVETFTKITKITTSVAQQNTPKVSDVKLKPIQKIIQKQAKLAKVVPQKTQYQRTVTYEQKQTQVKPKMTQRRVAYRQQTQVVNRQVNAPTALNVATTAQPRAVQQQTLETMVRHISMKTTPKTTTTLTSDMALEPIKSKTIQKQAKPTEVVPQKTQYQRTVTYEQKQTLVKPVELTQQRVVYKQQTQVVNRQVNAPTALDVATTAQPQIVQQQTMETMVRQNISMKTTPMTATLTNDMALEPVQYQTMEKQVKFSSQTSVIIQKIRYERTVTYEQKQTLVKPVELTQQRVVYKQQTQVVNRQVDAPTALNVATTAQPQIVQQQIMETMVRQNISMKTTPMTATATLTNDMALEPTQSQSMEKQANFASPTSVVIQKTQYQRTVTYEQKQTQVKPKMTQQRVAYQQTSQGVNRKSLDQPIDISSAAVQIAGQSMEPAETSALSTISRQERSSSQVSNSADSLVLNKRYTNQSNPAVSYTKASRSANISATQMKQGGQQQQRMMAVAYSPQAKSRSTRVDLNSPSTGTQTASLYGSPTSSMLSGKGQVATGEKNAPVITTELPSGNITQDTLYRLKGEVGGSVKQAFVTINEVTQLVAVENGKFEVEVAMVKGINNISILAFDSTGSVGKQNLKLLYNPPPGVPLVILESPQNGKQGVKEGDAVIVSGTIDTPEISQATLFLNGIPIKLKVAKGRFKKKIFMPNTRITTFRVTARNKNSPPGYSALHTILSGYDIDIVNPRPY